MATDYIDIFILIRGGRICPKHRLVPTKILTFRRPCRGQEWRERIVPKNVMGTTHCCWTRNDNAIILTLIAETLSWFARGWGGWGVGWGGWVGGGWGGVPPLISRPVKITMTPNLHKYTCAQIFTHTYMYMYVQWESIKICFDLNDNPSLFKCSTIKTKHES